MDLALNNKLLDMMLLEIDKKRSLKMMGLVDTKLKKLFNKMDMAENKKL